MERETTHLSRYIRALENGIVNSSQNEHQFGLGTVKKKILHQNEKLSCKWNPPTVF